MPKLCTLELTPEQHQTLSQMRDHHPRHHLREKAAALLKIAQGQRPCHVAKYGLLRARNPDTIYAWLKAYRQNGLADLFQKPRRKEAFSPSAGR